MLINVRLKYRTEGIYPVLSRGVPVKILNLTYIENFVVAVFVARNCATQKLT